MAIQKEPSSTSSFPDVGETEEDVIAELVDRGSADTKWRQGRSWSLVYSAGEGHTEFVQRAYLAYFSENGLSPTAFPSLGSMEADVVAMMCDLLGGDPYRSGGSMTSGGTESTLLAVKAHRDEDRARRPSASGRRSIVVPATAHPAFAKAAHFLDLELRVVPVDGDLRADVAGMAAAIDESTVMIAASAPCYPYGVVDPLNALGILAIEHNIGLHVDAALGGIMLPILRGRGRDVPHVGLDIPGVTSIGADLHKYGFGPKGAGTVLYGDEQLRRFQYFAYLPWPGGVLASPTMLGTRPGGAISASWAVLRHLGRRGYATLFESIMAISDRLREGISEIAGLHVIGDPPMSVFAFGSDKFDMWAIADELVSRGWRIDRQSNPDCIHLIVNGQHGHIVDEFLTDVREATAAAPPATDSAKRFLYGVTTAIDAGGDAESKVLSFLDDHLHRRVAPSHRR